MKVALFSPSQNPYSETFIQAHKNLINADRMFYIYGSSIESMTIEGKATLISNKKRIWLKSLSKILRIDKIKLFTNEASKSLIKLNVDVALVEYGNHAMKLVRLFKKANIPFVVHFHGYDISVSRIIEQHNNYQDLFKSASNIIGVSKLMCNQIRDLGCPQDKIVYNPCGANPTFENIKPHFKNKQVLSIGRFVDKKAPYYTILAFRKVINNFPDARLVMVGDGILFNTCKNLIRLYKLENNIKLLGAIPPKDIKNLMQNSYCFIQHSITAENGNQEGTPVAIMEAALAGLPVISTIHAGIPDVIEHEKTGLLSNEHDIDGMAKNIIRILEDTSLAKKLGANAKKIHKENFSMDNHIKTIEDLLLKSCN